MPSMRKSRLDKSKLSSLRSKNTEAQLTKDDLINVGDEIVSSTIEGFEEELAKSPALMRIAEKNSDLIKEFFIGYKEGVDSAIKEYIEGSTSTLEKTVETITKERVIDSKTAAGVVLQREKVFAQPEQSFGMKASEFGLSVLGELFGLDKLTQRKIEEKRQKEAFIQTESKLRPDVSKKQLAKDYEVIKEKEKELSTLQERSQILEKQGYSSDQIEKILDVTNKQNDIINTLMKVDPSRMGKYSASTTEEMQSEQEKINEKNLDEQENQTILLQEIRDILKEPKTKETSTTAAPLSGLSGLPLPMPLPTPGPSPSRRKPPLARKALEIGGNVFRKAMNAAPWVAAATGATNVITDIAQGKKIESLGDIVPEGWNIINPFEWATRAGGYVGEKINVGYGAASSALGGSGSLGGDIYDGVQGIKNVIGAGKPMIESGRGVYQTNNYNTTNNSSSSKIVTPAQEFKNVPFDPLTVGYYELPEPPPLAEKKEVNAIPASEIIDPDAAMFEAARQEKVNRSELLGSPKSITQTSDLIDPDAAMFEAARQEKVNRSELLGSPKNNSPIVSNSSLSPTPRLRFEVTAKKLPKVVETPRTTSATETAAEIGKNIVVNVPPPTVVQTPSQPTVVPTPFTNNVRNNGSSFNRYLDAY